MDRIDDLRELDEIEGIKDMLMEILKTQRLILTRIDHLAQAIARLEEK